ncbi:methyltransferase domain-containing protein [Rhodobacterales bacterium HKCCE3408]|nr:methyltransferase domain-containing protein [Rhodobacterales bacterium HKCCE3408]
MAKAGLAARQAALRALEPVLAEGEMLGAIEPRDGLSPGEAARARRLALIILRHMEPIDEILARFVKRPPQPEVQAILRLGAAELLIDGGAAHGVVDSAVRLAKGSQETARASGLVNAVLRKVAAEGPAMLAQIPAQKLPQWLRKPLIAAYGKPAVRAMEAAHAAGAPTDLTPKGDLEIEGAMRLPTGSLRLPDGAQVSALPGYNEGAFWVQDAAAALPVRCLGDVAGKRVLDLCAAPGGKTMQLAAAGAQVTALDISGPRLERVRENLTRTGLSAEIVVADALHWEGGQFDAILLDAPCTATGTIRRHPDLTFVRDETSVPPLLELQAALIDRALGWLAPGGRLVYCTCSLLPDEGEAQVAAALDRHPELAVAPVDPETLGGSADWAAPAGGLRLRPDFWPDLGGMDGFFMAALVRR